jgi:hypothetical protein
MRIDRYILDDDGEPQPCPDLRTWGRWMETADRTVLKSTHRGVVVSTVFLGLDHNFAAAGPPVLWETMIFGGVFDLSQQRYTSAIAALRGHAAALAMVIDDDR